MEAVRRLGGTGDERPRRFYGGKIHREHGATGREDSRGGCTAGLFHVQPDQQRRHDGEARREHKAEPICRVVEEILVREERAVCRPVPRGHRHVGNSKPRESLATLLESSERISKDDAVAGVEHLRAFVAAQNKGPRPVSMQGDPVLPGEPGQFIMAAALLKEIGAAGFVSSVSIDLKGEWRQKKEANGKRERLAIFRSKHHPDVVKGLLRCNKLAKDRESHLSEVCSATDRMLAEHCERLSQPLEIQICIEPDGTFKSAQMIERLTQGSGLDGKAVSVSGADIPSP